MQDFPAMLPDNGIGEDAAYDIFEEAILTKSAALGDPLALAHMDPPTPDIASRLVGLNARFNQNLLHPSLSPLATDIEARLIAWLTPAFGMTCGHMCSGSTLANLTAIWCAREAGATHVIASADAHISVAKSAHILGLPFVAIPVDDHGRMDRTQIADTSKAAIVLTAGTTGRGVIDDLSGIDCLWTHVDAAWAGPLRFTKYSARLDGIEHADSVAISAHKWFFQPKDSALVLFKSPTAQEAISFGGAYLATPNIGVQGSRGAAAIPLMATLIAWGQSGLAQRIEKNMADCETLAAYLANDPRTSLKQAPETAVLNWCPNDQSIETVLSHLTGTSSRTKIGTDTWIRQVAANPHADVEAIWVKICETL